MRIFYALIVLAVISSCHRESIKKNSFDEEKEEAAEAFSHWFTSRAFPYDNIQMSNYSRAFTEFRQKESMLRATSFPGSWSCIGPMNFGGRTLCLAFNPQNPNTIYAGSAAGGLWRSYSGGMGITAWQPVPTGFPILGIGAIAVNPADSNEIYIGTGEVYNYQNTGTGFAVRTTRGTYGIGILKSTDGGITWAKSLDWQYDELRGVQDIVINPQNPNTVFAATSEGTYRTFDNGTTWTLVHPVLMATDIAMNPNDTSMVFVASGNSFSANPGIYKSVNGGSTFTQLITGLPSSWSGKVLLSISQSQPNIIYASIANQLAQIGFYKSVDYGASWTLVNTEDIALYQGWYAHDVAVRPDNPNEVICVGIDAWKSYDGISTVTQKSFWYNWDFSATPIGGPEGPPDYVHADIHHVYFHPTNFDIVYYVTDGGIFRSDDGGETFAGYNGMYHTTQFYANLSNSPTDSLFVIGGMQDNATAVYEGAPAMRRVIGGDGLSTAIDPTDDNIVYGSSQNLNIDKSVDKAQTFSGTGNPDGNVVCFAGPFVLSPSNTQVLYAGSDIVYKSTNGGNNWNGTNSNNPLDGNPVLAMAISSTNQNIVYAATAPTVIPQMSLFKTTNGGNTWTDVTGTLPNRYLLDIAIDPANNNIVFVTLGGFGSAHLYKTINAGATWTAFGSGFPDVPTNTITIDPLNNLVMYLGNDLGVYVSIDGGNTWQPFNDGLDDATLICDISISESNRMLRIATHGKGIYERNMLPVNITTVTEINPTFDFSVYPNPAGEFIVISSEFGGKTKFDLTIFDANGKCCLRTLNSQLRTKIDVSKFKTGIYFLECIIDGRKTVTKLVKK
ncbi:MAG: T9SS type A sorting domain-containing protein [Bacteroidia bacterium]